MTDAIVSELIRRRIKKPFANVNEVADLITDETTRQANLSVSSQLYSINAKGEFHGKTVSIFAIYNRTSKRYLYYGIQ